MQARAPAPVTVVIPAFNAALTLDAALASVASQSLPPSSVVVADDQSDDGSPEVAERWSALLPLQIIQLERNAGPAAARRAAVDRADTELIALLDADDIWFPDHLALLIQTQEQHGDIVSADALRWYPGKGMHRVTHRARQPIPPADQQQVKIVRENFVSIGALFPRSAYEAVGGFRDGFSGAEDWDLWIRMIRAGLRVHAAPGPTFLYRVVSSGLTQTTDIFDVYVRVLEAAQRDASDEGERAAVADGLGRMRARREVAIARREAQSGHTRSARAAATRSLTGPRRVALEAGLLLASPSLGLRIGEAIRHWRR
jgi:GT2 family glycosyltransferase